MVLVAALEAATDGFAEVEDGGFGDGVDDIGTVAAASDDAGIGEGLEVAGGIGLGEVGGFDELGDIEFAGAEGLKDAEARGFTEDPEAGGDEFDEFRGEGQGRLGHEGEESARTGLRQTYNHTLISVWIGCPSWAWVGSVDCQPGQAWPSVIHTERQRHED